MKALKKVMLLLLIVGGINWGLVGVFDTNLVSEIFGTGTLTDVIYALVGIAALACIPRLLEGLHMGGHSTRPHGA